MVIVNEPAPEPPLLDEELLDEALLLPPEDDELPLELLEDDEPPLLEAELLLAPLEHLLLRRAAKRCAAMCPKASRMCMRPSTTRS